MDDLQKLMTEIKEWSDTTFGDNQRTVPILHHLIKEVPEAIDACKGKMINEHAKYELADCFMLILDACNHYGMNAYDILYYTSRKLEVNKKRRWGTPDINGVIEHISDET